MSSRGRGQRGALGEIARLGGLGVQFAVTVVVCTAAGWWADRELGTSPWVLFAGVFIGAVAAFYQVCRALISHDRQEDREGGK